MLLQQLKVEDAHRSALERNGRGQIQSKAFLSALFDLALEEQWFDLQHMIQHDMAKAIIADYSYETGRGYLNQDIYFNSWEDVIEIGWSTFCSHTGVSRSKVESCLAKLRE